jgi:hypothetical protein
MRKGTEDDEVINRTGNRISHVGRIGSIWALPKTLFRLRLKYYVTQERNRERMRWLFRSEWW